MSCLHSGELASRDARVPDPSRFGNVGDGGTEGNCLRDSGETAFA
jgi:hypothetical protein